MTTPPPVDLVQLVVFGVGGQPFACDIFQVERILRWETPTPLPNAPDFLEGVITYQDSAVPLVDLRKRLSVPAAHGDDTRVIVFGTDQGRLAAVVDAVHEVRKVDAARITPPARVVKGFAAQCISGLVRLDDRTVIILALTRLLSSDEQVALTDFVAGAKA